MMEKDGNCLVDLGKGAETAAHDDLNDDSIELTPEDLDLDKFNQGRHFFRRNINQCLQAMMFSLVTGLCVRNLLGVLVATGRTSQPKQSFFRYVRTTVHVLKWHYGNIWDKNSSARTSILAVRKYHNEARYLMQCKDKKQANEEAGLPDEPCVTGTCLTGRQKYVEEISKFGDNDEIKAEKEKVHVSQYDMSIVQCGFMGAIIMYPQNFGIICSDSDLDDYVYFWRWIGWLLGIEDRNNICSHGYIAAYDHCKAIENEILMPSLDDPPEHFYHMAKAFIDGMNKIVFFSVQVYTPESIIALTYEAMKRPCPYKLSIADRIRMFVLKCIVLFRLYVPGFSWCTNRLLEYGFQCDKMT